MKKNLFLKLLLAALLLGLFGCSKSDDGPLDAPGEESSPEAVSRFVNVKANMDCSSEFAALHVIELDASLNESGREFIIKKGDSNYFRDSISLRNRYALLRAENLLVPTTMAVGANGAKVPADFEVLVDLENPAVSYFSLAGHFVTARAKKLVSGGTPADSAISQAESELYKAFAFDSDSLTSTSILQYNFYSDAWLAEGVILRIFEQFILTGKFEEEEKSFESEFAEKGKIAKYDAFYKVADYLVDKIYVETVQHSNLYYKEKRIVNESVYTRQFYTKVLELGKCDSKKICESTKLDFEKSDFNDTTFICDTLGWVLATNVWLNTCPYGAGKDYEIKKGVVDSTEQYYYHPVLNEWKQLDYVQTQVGICTDERNGEYAFIKDYAYFKCGNRLWQKVSRDEYNLADIKCDTLPKHYILGRDSITRYACTEGVVTPLAPEESLYVENTWGLPCDTTPALVLGHDSTTYYVCDAQRLRVANELELSAKRACVSSNYDELLQIQNSFYRCRGTWKYANDTIYRDTVTDARDGKSYPLVGMGAQLWFAVNLNYETDSSWCYNDSTEYCEIKGRIYRLAEAASKNKDSLLCPSGFHVPTKEEYETLMEFAEKWVPASQRMSMTHGLLSEKSGGKDYFGFNALIAGKRHLDGEYTSYEVDYCTSSEVGTDGHYRWLYDSRQYLTTGTAKGNNYCYMRCIAD